MGVFDELAEGCAKDLRKAVEALGCHVVGQGDVIVRTLGDKSTITYSMATGRSYLCISTCTYELPLSKSKSVLTDVAKAAKTLIEDLSAEVVKKADKQPVCVLDNFPVRLEVAPGVDRILLEARIYASVGPRSDHL